MRHTLVFLFFCSLLFSGCAHRSGFMVEPSPGYAITYPEITWDYPGDRARVVYKSHDELQAIFEKSAKERHLEKATPAPAGGALVVYVVVEHAHDVSGLEAIVLRGGQVEQRARFPIKDARVESGQSSAFLKASAWIDLDVAPELGTPIQLDIVGPGLKDGPYSFKLTKL